MNVNCNVEFAADGVAVDHFGNVPGDYESEGSDRSNFWLPVGPSLGLLLVKSGQWEQDIILKVGWYQ